MMQALNVKQVSKTQVANTAVQQALINQFKKSDVKTATVAELKVVESIKAPSFSRTLEAYGDCV